MSGVNAATVSSGSSFLVGINFIVDGGDIVGTTQSFQPIQLAQFDPSLGTLTDVTFNLNSDVGYRLDVAGFSTPLASPVHGLAASDYTLSMADPFTGTLFQKGFHNDAECSLANRLLCTATDSHLGEIYDGSLHVTPLAGYQGVGSYDVTIGQLLNVTVGGSGGEAGWVGGWQGDLEVVYSYTVVPIPTAIWLFGSGLLGLAGIAKRRKT